MNSEDDTKEKTYEPTVSKKHFTENFPLEYEQYNKLEFKRLTFRTKDRDNCVMIKSQIYLIRNILMYSDSIFIKLNKFREMKSFYNVGLPSTELGIFLVSNLEKKLSNRINLFNRKKMFFDSIINHIQTKKRRYRLFKR